MALTMESILKLSPKKKLLLLAGILVVLGGLYLHHFILPEMEKRKDMEIQLGKLQKELTESKAVERDLKKYKEQVTQMNQELEQALQQLPNEKEIPELLKNVSSLGKNAQLEFVLFKPKPEEPQQFYARVPIELTLVGTYHNTGLFFDRVSKLSRIVNVVDFNMARTKETGKAKEGTDEISIRTSCLVNTYRFIEKKSEEKKGEKKSEKKSENK